MLLEYLLTANNNSCAEALNRKRDTHHLIKVKQLKIGLKAALQWQSANDHNLTGM